MVAAYCGDDDFRGGWGRKAFYMRDGDAVHACFGDGYAGEIGCDVRIEINCALQFIEELGGDVEFGDDAIFGLVLGYGAGSVWVDLGDGEAQRLRPIDDDLGGIEVVFRA